jgi:hypothetical protein
MTAAQLDVALHVWDNAPHHLNISEGSQSGVGSGGMLWGVGSTVPVTEGTTCLYVSRCSWSCFSLASLLAALFSASAAGHGAVGGPQAWQTRVRSCKASKMPSFRWSSIAAKLCLEPTRLWPVSAKTPSSCSRQVFDMTSSRGLVLNRSA